MKLTVGELLRQGRKNVNMSVQDVSSYLEKKGIFVATKSIYGWENNTSHPSLHIFFTLCVRYGITDILGSLGYLDNDTNQ